MADNVKELFPEMPTEEVDQYKVTVWTYDIYFSQTSLRKICWEYHINTPWASVYPDGRSGADFVSQWCIRHNDGKHYEGRMLEGWDRIFDVRGRYFLTEPEAKQAAIERLIELMNEELRFVEECGESIVELMTLTKVEEGRN